MNPKSKEFQALQAKWYKKAKSSGFEDIEQKDGNLKIWDSSYFALRYVPLTFEAKAEYYVMVGQFLYTHKFKNAEEKKFWRYHSKGKSIRDIARQCGVNPEKVYLRLNALTKEMLKNVHKSV